MKIKLLSALLFTMVLLCGCSSVKFTEYHGSTVFQGKGGALRSVDDVEIWEDGEPDRKYKILGFVEESRGHRVPLGRISRLFSNSSDSDSAIVKAAHKHGGDAVIIVGGSQEPASDEGYGRGSHQRTKKVVIIKYVE
jgi:hypothetical protein